MAVNGILGRKIGMTQIFLEDGSLVGVTAVQAGPCSVTQIRVPEKDSYSAVQIGFSEARNLTNPERGHLKNVGKLYRHLREVSADDYSGIEVGDPVEVDIFSEGDRIDAIGTSKGHGFTGGVKRHGFHGGPKTHGQSDRHRAPGSIGSGTFPGRVWKGTKMAGHWGVERVTVQNLEIVQIDKERNLLFIKGAVPGASKGLLLLQRSKGAK
jgi:large subunit ribosomal protein L3